MELEDTKYLKENEMKNWTVMLSVDATIRVSVAAETEEEAKEKALDIASRPDICHQCSKKVEIGDVLDALEATELDG